MSILKVLQVFTIMDRGGAESMIMNYYREIDKTKVQFDFLVHRKKKGAFDDEIIVLGGKIFHLNTINPIFPNDYYKALRGFFQKNTEYTVVHSHLNTFSSFPLKIAREFKIPCRIAHAHIAIDKVTILSLLKGKENIKESIKKIIKLQLKRNVNKYATHYFSCGEKAGQWLFGANSAFKTMNNAIRTDDFTYSSTIANEYKKEFNINEAFVIGHVGRFSSQKNHMFLLQTFAKVVTLIENSYLVLVGDGPDRKKIESEARRLGILDKVLFLGVRADIPQLYQMFDIFVFPSFYEGLPVTLIEAQAAGLMIIASNTITTEVRLTENIKLLSLDDSADLWAKTIVENKKYERKSHKKEIAKGGYDIVSNTLKIQEFYIQF